MQQGTPEWFAARCGSLGASCFHDIIARTKTGFSTSRENRKAALVLEIVTGKTLDTHQSAAMLQGTEREPAGRAAYAFLENVDVEEVGLIRHPTIARTHASPDGLIGSEGMIEIKCMQPAGHLDLLLTGRIDAKYMTQMAWAMACSGRAYCDFVAYSPDFPEEMQLIIKRIPRDGEVIAELEKAARAFIAEVEATVTTLRQRYAIEEAA
jgi:hypothetical protein